MMHAFHSTRWILALVFVGLFPLAAAAQPVASAYQIGVGYQLLHIPDTNSDIGFNVDVSRAVNDDWDVVVEAGLANFDAPGDDTGSADVSHYAGGVRFERPLNERVSAFAQGLAGVERASSEFDTDWAFMIQPGAGIYASIGPRWGALVQFDLRPVFFEEEVDEQWRFVAGIRFRLQ